MTTSVACAQFAPEFGDVAGNCAAITDLIGRAVAAGADVVVLPELATTGYMFTDADEARALALPSSAPVFADWAAAAGDAIVVVGYCEAGDDGHVYNSAVMLDRGGVVAGYRKTHLWDREKLVFTPGSVLPPVVKTRHGNIAMMVCYDLEFAEVTRAVTVAGAELIVASVNWPLFPRPEGERPGEVITAMSTARLNRVAVAVCDRCGVERGQPWTAGTVIVDPDGWVAAAAGPGPELVLAEVDLTLTHDKSLTEHVDLLADRRLDLY